jgi:radical SAM superfamily enzyme
LPGEGPREVKATAAYLAGLPLRGVKMHLLYVVRGSGLARLYAEGAYHCLTADQYLQQAVDFLELLPPHLVIHRLTGDPHPEELLAPDWCLDKARVLSGIREELARRGSRQGSRWTPASGKSL